MPVHKSNKNANKNNGQWRNNGTNKRMPSIKTPKPPKKNKK